MGTKPSRARPPLREDVSLQDAKRRLRGQLAHGQALLREWEGMWGELADSSATQSGTTATEIFIRHQTLPEWRRKRERWVRVTWQQLDGVFSKKVPAAEDFERTATLVTDAGPFDLQGELRNAKDSLDRSLEQLQNIAKSLRNDRVMVIHGRNELARQAIFQFLRALTLEPIEWDQAVTDTGRGTPHNLDAVNAAMENAQAVVALFTPDDLAHLRPELSDAGEPPTGQPRPNVLLETGMAHVLMPEDYIVVHLGRIRKATTDLDGLNYVKLPSQRESLRQRLIDRGCLVDKSSESWRTAGDFEGALATIGQPAGAELAGRAAQSSSRSSPSVQ